MTSSLARVSLDPPIGLFCEGVLVRGWQGRRRVHAGGMCEEDNAASVDSSAAELGSIGGSRVKLAVVFGGKNPEHGISCLSAASILAAVDREVFEVRAIGIGRDGMWRAVSDDPQDWCSRGVGQVPQVSGPVLPLTELLTGIDVVFPVLHGKYGEDGTIQGLLEMLSIPYVGSGVLASAAAMDKVVTKTLLRAHGLAVGDFVAVNACDWDRNLERIEADVAGLGMPVFVKPARAGSSVGISKVRDLAALPAALAVAAAHDRKLIIEAGVEGAREIEISVLEDLDGMSARISVPAEIQIHKDHEFYDYDAKYFDGRSRVIIPAQLAPGTLKDVEELAAAAFEVIGCSGLARADFFITADGRAIINELNTMPGFTPSSGFPKMWQASGIGYSELIGRLIEKALIVAGRGG